MKITSRITAKAAALRVAKPFQQFGQPNDAYTANGATGCTQTVLQYLALLWLNKWWTHDQISRTVGLGNMSLRAPKDRHGMTPAHVALFIKAAGLPYKVVRDATFAQVLEASKLGPVGIAHGYDWVPEWKGFRIGGITSDGKPNGYAEPLGRAGKTQLAGFHGGHMGCLIGSGVGDDCTGVVQIFWEPNHGSPARPEKPAYDQITTAQMQAVYESYKKQLGQKLYAVVPTKALPV